jgi:hypothetical protein
MLKMTSPLASNTTKESNMQVLINLAIMFSPIILMGIAILVVDGVN